MNLVLEKLSLGTLNFYAPRFEVEIENQKLTANISKAILNVKVNEKIDEGVSFELTIHDDFDFTKQKFKWLDHPLFSIGNKITIKMGYGSNLFPMVMGNITSLEPSFFTGETPTLTVGGQDLSYDYIKRTSPERTFVDKTYSDIARTIASEAGLLPVVDDTGKFLRSMRKNNNETYYAFLERLAKEVDYEFKMDGQTMYFIKPEDDKKEILILELGKDIISFRPTLRTTGLYTEVEVRGHNPRDPTKPIIGKATAGDERNQEPGKKTGSQVAKELGTFKKVISNVIVNSEAHANSIAKAELNKASDTLVEGDGECIGIPQIRTGTTIRLEKMGTRFSGKYYIKETTHTINESGYRTNFSVKRNAL
ncbi:MAG: contractile injection system protein, VgrG/Pvc8 family [Candidatus Methanoperedens sp.]|nr:contractile injection system protein, VgrG/Pvc8 family [Candidatus Methanoperedens sp.]HLB71689.1 contractile injection system protein, VgrG/Pvc8 family [Candidatus Methanoperedens sp.]